ncbi:MAG: ABC transporter ATP-binding protein [Rhodobacteraceae bacterium]|nr:ABC transporter ATP-binding protein [Paracoccaceae bacterium]
MVRGQSFDVAPGETVALVGESGSGKSNAVLGLLDLVRDPGRRHMDSIVFDGLDLNTLSHRQMRQIRGRRIAMIFQDPMTALNPLITVGKQLVALAMEHFGLAKREARARAVETLVKVSITAAEQRMAAYPHQFSGAIRQRVMIAMALIGEPDLQIADEPTMALDVSIQAQIINPLKRLQRGRDLTYLFISHDMAVVRHMSDRVAVMHLGVIEELGEGNQIYDTPSHPYTRALLKAVPVPQVTPGAKATVQGIRGELGSPLTLPSGCRFCEHCPLVQDRCRTEPPRQHALESGHLVVCHVA